MRSTSCSIGCPVAEGGEATPVPAGGWRILVVFALIGAVLAVGSALLAAGLVALGLDDSGGPNAEAISDYLRVLENRELYTIPAMAMQALAMILVPWLVVLRFQRLSWRDVGLRPIGAGWIGGAVGLGLLMLPVGGLTAAAVQELLGRTEQAPQLEYLAPEGLTPSAVVAAFVLGGLVQPFAEELLFRGMLFPWLRRRLGLAAGVVLSGLAFGLVHNLQGGLEAVAAATVPIGMALAIAYQYSGSLWVPYVMHVTFNLMGLTGMMLAAQAGAAGLQTTSATGCDRSATAQAVAAPQCSASAAHNASAAFSTPGPSACTVTTAERVAAAIGVRAS